MHFRNGPLTEVIEQLKDKLVPYLKSCGINIESSGLFKCINPLHDDHAPSCGIVPGSNGTIFHCFGCQESGTITKAAHWLEKMPLSGPAFITSTITELAKRYDIQMPKSELSKEEQELMEVYRAYEEAEYIIRYSTYNTKNEEFKKRGWNYDVGEKYGIGFIKSYNDFIKAMKEQGFTEEYLQKVNLRRMDLFNPDNMIFTVYDRWGSPIGFAARNLKYEEQTERYKQLKAEHPDTTLSHPVKYINTSNNCPVYKKSQILYGMHIARNATTTHGLIIVEGYADWVTLQEQGIRNCAAIGGTALTEDHIFLISELGIKKISLCLDGDASGRAATTKILDEVISKAPRLAVDIIMLPEGLDPDDYIKQNKATTASPWDTVPIVSCFSWRLKELTKDAPPEEVATRMIPLIMTESSMVKREQLAKELAGQTAIRFETIISELDRLGNIEKLKNSERWNSIAKDIASDLMRKPTNAKIILEQGLEHLSGLESGDSIENLGVDEMLNGFEAVTQNWLSRSTEILGLRTGFKEFDNAFSGLQKAKLYLFGGKPNHGKTALMHSIALGVCRNSDDNTTVIVHSTDDDRPTVMARIVSGITGIPINDVTNPKIAFKLPAPLDGKIHDQYLVQKWKDGVAELKEYLASGKLVIKDINNGNTLGFTESLIKYYKEKNPERNYVVIFDNFHKAQDFPELGEQEVTRTKKMSEQCKTICQRYNVPFLATVEYRKIREGYRPTSSDVASSGQLHYDSDVLAHVYNDFHDKGNEIGASKFVTIIEGNTIPIIDVTVSKNKLSSFKGRLHFYLHGDKGSVRECPASHIANIISAQQNPEALRGLNGQ